MTTLASHAPHAPHAPHADPLPATLQDDRAFAAYLRSAALDCGLWRDLDPAGPSYLLMAGVSMLLCQSMSGAEVAARARGILPQSRTQPTPFADASTAAASARRRLVACKSA